MKLNKNKISALLGVGLIGALTFGPTLNTQAALTAPTNWDLRYYYTGTTWRISNTTTGFNDPVYTRTGSSPNYNYQSSWNWNTFNILPVGLTINMGFASVNIGGFVSAGTDIYKPTTAYIGSDNTVGTLVKFSLQIDNQTDKDYVLYYDRSSSGSPWYYSFLYDDVFFYGDQAENYLAGSALLNKVIVPSFTKFEIRAVSSNRADYFDAWYLQDLGVSASYNQGTIDGYGEGLEDTDAYAIGYQEGLTNNPNILLNGFQAMVGILVNFALMIFNLNVFGVSLLNIFGILALFVGLIWILKIVRG